ncbi:hypothetical protein [Metabacillus fastidiosus]|uniref:hypothetical protein n=1 Tax=Metabacillus fastidiosus TaxID=1458 RepID=UPI002E1FBAB5|nr:hypothetical protein [Metabacillus fastidiosus]
MIKVLSESFKIASDEKEEVLLRIDWLDRLYKAKEKIKLINTREEAQFLRRLIASVQTCPMKTQLMAELDLLEQLLPAKEMPSEKTSTGELLMEKTIEEAGEVFINLGKAGREHIVREVLNQYGDNADVEHIKELSTILERRVESLKEEKDRHQLAMSLEQLPIPLFSRLGDERKEIVINRLIENSKWNGLASLDRMIAQLDKVIIIEEEMKNTVLIPGGMAIFTLDADKDENGIIQINE